MHRSGHMNASQQPPHPMHDIFISHSGAQKGFVTDLYHELKSCCFRPFFDAEYDSLPLAESFPPHILAAASTCKLALVILSDEYLSSKWPMIELCWFMDAKVKILPIFFHLSPPELKKKSNKRKWKSFAKSDPRIVVSNWERALKSLRSIHGIIYDGAARKGEQSFIKEIVRSICTSQTLVPESIYDTSYMQGRDRLHQIILDKFEKMESGKQHEPFGDPSTSSISPQIGIASILGIYGLPGSGKSTLCRSLHGYFFPRYPGKCLYLNLPTNPTPSDMIDEIGRTFRLTTSLAHIDQVMSLLKDHPLARKPIFLVVDNICDKSCEVVQRILYSVIGPGSRVVVVARTLDLLRPALVSPLLGHEGSTCICDSIPMPTINEEEATNLLIMEASIRQEYCGIAGPNQLDLIKQKDKVLTVVRMCGFQSTKCSNSRLDYLPLVVKRMGVMLARYEDDVDGWARGQEKVWSSSSDDEDLKIYRKDVVHELIWESFKDSLDAQLQLVFLDAALFLQPSRVREVHEACSILGSMHGEDVALIKKLFKDLKRLCFIDGLSKHGGIFVHDVYVEFAKSIQNKGLSPWSYIWNEDIFQWDAMTDQVEMKQENTQRPVRAISFEVKEGCERIDLKGLTSLKALVLRNCGSLVALRMAGLTSLAILDMTGFRVLPRLECYDYDLYASVRNLKRLSFKSKHGNYLGNVMSKQQGYFTHQGYCRSVVSAIYLGSSIINTLLQRMQMRNFVPAFVKKPSSLDLAKHMKGLQVFRLEGTGVRNLEDMGSCSWPHLQELHVEEYFLEGIRLGTLPALKTFHCYTLPCPCPKDVIYYDRDPPIRERSGPKSEGKDLLMGCPALQDVDVRTGLFRNVALMKPTWRGLRVLRLSLVKSSMELGDVIASSAHTLEHLDIRHCGKIERVNVSAPGQLPNLTELTIRECPGIVEVKFGLQALPRLTRLTVMYVSETCVLSGLEELRLLEDLRVVCCSVLQPANCSLSGLVRLKNLFLLQYPRAWELHRALDFKSAGFEGLSNLETLCIKAAADRSDRLTGQPINLASLTNLVRLTTDGTLLLEGLHSLPRLERVSISSLQTSDEEPPLMLQPEGSLHLDSFPGKQLTSLQVASRCLTRLDGIECLTHLQFFDLVGCPLLEELPSLHALHDMRYLRIYNCVKLKAVQGCDEMRKLERVVFYRCTSMEQLPFKDMYALGCTHPLLRHLGFSGCGFAMDTKRELLIEWPARVSILLGEALLKQLIWEFYRSPEEMKEGLEEAIVACLQSLVTLFPLGDLEDRGINKFYSDYDISTAWKILIKRVLAGKLKKDLLHPSVLARLLEIVRGDIKMMTSYDHEEICFMYGKLVQSKEWALY